MIPPVPAPGNTTVVLIHGWGAHGVLMSYLARRLRAAGFTTLSLSYPSMWRSPADNADYLYHRIQSIRTPAVHLLGHSLGGIILLHILRRYNLGAGCRLVLLGVPVQGCALARRARQSAAGRWLLNALVDPLDPSPLKIIPFEHSPERSSIGIIAGTRNFGLLARLFGSTLNGDGVIELSETVLEGSARCELPCSHTGLLFSPQCATEVCCFLRSGVFSVGDENAKIGRLE